MTTLYLTPEILNAHYPCIGDYDRAIFIWDNALFDELGYDFKRRVFIYEALVSQEVEIYQGDSLEVLRAIEDDIVVIRATNPIIAAHIDQLRTLVGMTVITPRSFVLEGDQRVFKRFFQYWKYARKEVLNAPQTTSTH